MLQPLILDRFKRVNDKVAPDLIGGDELSVLTDAVLDYKIGKPVKRGHFSRYDAEVPAGADILKLADTINNAGLHRILGAVGTKVRRYSAADDAWDDFILGLTSGHKFRYVPFADKLIFTFDTDDDPVMGSNDLATYWNLELGVANISSIISLHGDSGNLTVSTQYHWVMVGLTEDGQLAPPSKPFTHYFDIYKKHTTGTGTTATKIYFKDLPYIADSRVVSRMIFRNKADDIGRPFYLAAILDNDYTGGEYQTEWEDNLADDDLGTEIAIYLNTPTRSEHIAFSNEMLFLGNISLINKNHYSPPSSHVGYDGTHTGANNSTNSMTDSTQNWDTNEVKGKYIYNITDGCYGIITSNTATQVLCSGGFVGGTDGDFDTGDQYIIIAGIGYEGVNNNGFALTSVDSNSSGGTLLFNTEYNYKIHWVDKYNRLSEYYHQVDVTTDNDAVNTHSIGIYGIGHLTKIISEECPTIAIYRRTNGTGDYKLIAKCNNQDYIIGNGWLYNLSSVLTGAYFVDYGAADLTESWLDPATDTNSYGSAIAFSDISAPSTFRDENIRQIFSDDSNEITGMSDDQEGLIIFKKNSINKLFLAGDPNNWRLVKLVKEYGCDQPDTLQKSGGSYYFIFQNKAYRYDYGADKPVDIGYFYQGTLDTIQSWYDSTINDKWYCIQCKTATVSYTLVYDIKLETWYKFKRTQSAGEDFKTIYFTKYGSAEELLSNADSYISIYNKLTDSPTATRADTEIGSTRQISPVVTSKTYKFPDGVTLARLRKQKFDYTKVVSQDTSIILTDEDTASTIVLTDNTGSGKKLFESGIGTATDTVKKVRALSISVQGAGFERWDNLRIEYRPIREGKAVSL